MKEQSIPSREDDVMLLRELLGWLDVEGDFSGSLPCTLILCGLGNGFFCEEIAQVLKVIAS